MEDKPIRDEKGHFLPGSPGGPGRPPGSISPITKVKQIFEEDPERFKEFIESYIEDPANRKHIVEMIDGKPQQDITSKGERILPTPIMSIPHTELNALPPNDSNEQDSPAV